MNKDIYYKIHKYQQKLELKPNNTIYQYKLKYYYQMIGGQPKSSIPSTQFKCIMQIYDKTKLRNNCSHNPEIYYKTRYHDLEEQQNSICDYNTKKKLKKNEELL